MQITELPETATGTRQTLYLILYPQSSHDDVVEVLDRIGAPGFTETEKVVGRGARGRHFDNQIWPGADGMIYAVVGPGQSEALATALSKYSRALEEHSRGLYGLHVFTWRCHQLI